ncbi:MAG: hypothetical protein BAJALOKI1v1_120002 [Promethearchaeota archaeon]|nr:MAG: hypothetical protein BAJALOKI1v1_120002 [Candidatus Lokiarchaeota archaeon]
MSEKKALVSLARHHNISKAIIESLNHLKLPDLTGKTILLKPNVGRESDSSFGINTNPEVVSAIYEYLSDRFDARFFIGDSPIINTDTHKAFKQSGYTQLLAKKELQFIDLDEKKPIELSIPQGKIIKKIKVTGYWDEFDYIISIPVLKMHMHCGASLSFKNLKGIIYKREKIRLHHKQAPELIKHYKEQLSKIKELDIAIADLVHAFRPNLSIIDASYAQGGMGPSSGEIIKLDTIISSTNFFAADVIALAITQPAWTLKDVPHLYLISHYLPKMPSSMEQIQTIPDDISAFIHPLAAPPETISIKYKNVHLIDIDSCSACLSTIFNLLKNNKQFIDKHFTEEKPLNLAIGKGVSQSDLYGDTYLIGNCISKLKTDGIFIQGCTPVESKILARIKQQLGLETEETTSN